MQINTPREIARNIALYTTLITGAIVLPVIIFFTEGIYPWLIYIAAVVGVYSTSYFMINFAIERFIHKKIKLIYKTIHRLKTQKKSASSINYNSDVLSDVNKEVLEWARDNRQEIDQLKQQAEYRKEFIGNLAHELKTPAFSIQGYLLTLLEGGLEDPSINRNYLQRADKNLDRLINLINEMDEITKLESGETPIEPEKFDLVELAKEVVEEVEYKAQKSNIELNLIAPKKNIMVDADKDKIAQVLTNLIVNSIKYGKEGGKTSIKFYDLDENILIELEDNGVGIAEEHLPRLFERFYRVDKSRSRHQGGSGLGLSIVKHIMDAHKQTINVRSTEGEGSTFSFTLTKA